MSGGANREIGAFALVSRRWGEPGFLLVEHIHQGNNIISI